MNRRRFFFAPLGLVALGMGAQPVKETKLVVNVRVGAVEVDTDELINDLRKRISEDDLILIDGNSRQAASLRR